MMYCTVQHGGRPHAVCRQLCRHLQLFSLRLHSFCLFYIWSIINVVRSVCRQLIRWNGESLEPCSCDGTCCLSACPIQRLLVGLWRYIWLQYESHHTRLTRPPPLLLLLLPLTLLMRCASRREMNTMLLQSSSPLFSYLDAYTHC